MTDRREDAPHTAVLFLHFEVHEKMPSGELRGVPVDKGDRVYKIEGADKFICLNRLNEMLGVLNDGTAGQAQ